MHMLQILLILRKKGYVLIPNIFQKRRGVGVGKGWYAGGG